MRKAVLEQNILPKAKQRLVFTGLPDSEILWITRDVMNIALGVIELPDQTKVPGGRRRAFEFTATLQFARDVDREAMLNWFNLAVDSGQEKNGIDPHYKRDGTITYCRLYTGSSNRGSQGSEVLQPVRAQLYGVWCSQYNLPDYDINGDEGDGDCVMECTFQCDDAAVERKNAIQNVTNRNAPNGQNNGILGLGGVLGGL